MRIFIACSKHFYDEIIDIKSQLERMSHQVQIPPNKVIDKNGNPMDVKKYYEIRQNRSEDEDWIWERKKEAMLKHLEKVAWSDSILVTNYDKKGIANYIGSNTLIEMGLALWLEKGIYLLNPIPEMPCREEILGMQPFILNQDLTKIR